MYIDSESELRKLGSQAKKFVLKDFAGKFGALFFIGFGYKIDAPICRNVKWSFNGFPKGALRVDLSKGTS